MSLTNSADLQTQVGNWLARDDLNPFIPDMITLFEAAAARKLKVRPQETTASITTSGGTGVLPAGFLGFRRVTWTGSPLTELTYVAPPIFSEYTFPGNAAPPSFYTIEGGNIRITPIDDTGLQVVYNQKSAALSSALNWLFTNHPDAYLFGTLAEANFFMKGSALPLAATWLQRRDEIFSEIGLLDFNERNGMAMRIMGATP